MLNLKINKMKTTKKIQNTAASALTIATVIFIAVTLIAVTIELFRDLDALNAAY